MRLTVIMLFAVLLILTLPVIVGSYVYKDAKKRNMDAVLWTAVVILVPGLVGLIIYLIVRGNSSDATCPVCENDVSDSHVLCPYCGNPLKLCCKNCQTVISPSWKLCPQCGTEIKPEDFAQFKEPKPKKEKSIRGLVIVLIVVPLLALIIGIIGLRLFSFDSGHVSLSSMSGYHLEVPANDVGPEIKAWIADCDAKGGGVYVLRLSPEKSALLVTDNIEDKESSFYAYVYINQYVGAPGLTGTTNINGRTLEIEYFGSFDEEEKMINGYELSEFHVIGPTIQNIKVLIDGALVDAVVTDLK